MGGERAWMLTNRARAYSLVGDQDKAMQDYGWAIEADPGWTVAYLNRAGVYVGRGDCAAAAKDYDQAVRTSTQGLRQLALIQEANLYATCPDPGFRDPAKAMDLARASLKVKESAPGHDAMAMALGAAGRYDEALREETRATEIASKSKSADERAGYKSRLEWYQKAVAGNQPAGTPIRDAP